MAGDMFIDRLKLIEPDLHCWFKSEVEPINKLLREGVEVYGMNIGPFNSWSEDSKSFLSEPRCKALIINIQPIKPKTREEKAMELLREIYDDNGTIEHYWWKRVKELLESKDE